MKGLTALMLLSLITRPHVRHGDRLPEYHEPVPGHMGHRAPGGGRSYPSQSRALRSPY